MHRHEYTVIPAPDRGSRAKGAKTPGERYALALAQILNDMAAQGWDYLRAETLPSDERSGIASRHTLWHNVLIFRRALTDEAADRVAPAAPIATASPQPQARPVPAAAPAPSTPAPSTPAPSPPAPPPADPGVKAAPDLAPPKPAAEAEAGTPPLRRKDPPPPASPRLGPAAR